MLLKGGKPANKSPANVQVSFKGNSNAISDDVVLSFWRTFALILDSNHDDQHQHLVLMLIMITVSVSVSDQQKFSKMKVQHRQKLRSSFL